ncbi:cytochrome o ubiquinol oxidase subunit IV [Bordetella bronchiseptica]|uniref:cytochrome o ubiquinol oxidase subunit IV n=1 Tax=Bordetella bronchiseptica TaxID=518 RepID=UPI0004A0CB55|nr:cytochrome o ubiquinol oxidase subunit IV [Bordetella bronchiseptica]KDB61837.1 cytochrome o ubiquinol oxidase, subunit IV [Bordetella bronchiseptica A1-7]KDB68324.1 cytochrome o ubiquinol oxidase, subunit IV [Bordetella bronchiseptica B20-10725633]KDC70474.1 cytochrome o ubiquinol oxidase, subunit IV [Bordetella bronchiseptica MBORD632]
MSHAVTSEDHGHADHGSLKSYLIGFAISLVLTFGSFGLVMAGAVPRGIALAGVVVLCVAQLLVQLVFFLHMGGSKKQRDNVTTFVFTILIIAIIVGGSVWVLHNMNANMMHPMPG